MENGEDGLPESREFKVVVDPTEINHFNGKPWKYGKEDWRSDTGTISQYEAKVLEPTRFLAFKAAMEALAPQIKDKVVLEVNAGLGIYSMIAARLGAAKVITIESSDLANTGKQIVIDNKLDHIVTVVHNRVQDITELPDGITQVDFIISDFLGDCVFIGAEIDSFILAKEKWLNRETGILIPDKITFYIWGINDPETREAHLKHWGNSARLYGLKGSDYYFLLQRLNYVYPKKYWVREDQLVTDSEELTTLDLEKLTLKELHDGLNFRFKITASGNRGSAVCNGIGVHFEAVFSKGDKKTYYFATGPWQTQAAFPQIVFFFRSTGITMPPFSDLVGNFQVIRCKENIRDVDFKITYKFISHRRDEADAIEEKGAYTGRALEL